MKEVLKTAFLLVFFAGLISMSFAKDTEKQVEKTVTVIDWKVAKEVIMEAYIYAYPLIISEITKEQTTNYPEPTGLVGQAPENQFAHARIFPDANFISSKNLSHCSSFQT